MILVRNMNKDTQHVVDCSLSTYLYHMGHVCNLERRRGSTQDEYCQSVQDHFCERGWFVEDYHPEAHYSLSNAPHPHLVDW